MVTVQMLPEQQEGLRDSVADGEFESGLCAGLNESPGVGLLSSGLACPFLCCPLHTHVHTGFSPVALGLRLWGNGGETEGSIGTQVDSFVTLKSGLIFANNLPEGVSSMGP